MKCSFSLFLLGCLLVCACGGTIHENNLGEKGTGLLQGKLLPPIETTNPGGMLHLGTISSGQVVVYQMQAYADPLFPAYHNLPVAPDKYQILLDVPEDIDLDVFVYQTNPYGQDRELQPVYSSIKTTGIPEDLVIGSKIDFTRSWYIAVDFFKAGSSRSNCEYSLRVIPKVKVSDGIGERDELAVYGLPNSGFPVDFDLGPQFGQYLKTPRSLGACNNCSMFNNSRIKVYMGAKSNTNLDLFDMYVDRDDLPVFGQLDDPTGNQRSTESYQDDNVVICVTEEDNNKDFYLLVFNKSISSKVESFGVQVYLENIGSCVKG